MSEVAIEIKELVKHYDTRHPPAVDGLSLTINKGEIMGLLGPNGAGKTTTISLISGVLKPDSGEITIFGNAPGKQSQMLCGTVPQEIALYEKLTVWENLRFFAGAYGISGNKWKPEAEFWLHRLGLYDRRKEKMNRFSGGMKRRVNLIAALLHKPKVLFLDEPTVGIDVQSKNIVIEQLREINKSGVTIVYTSHHMDEAEHFCTRVSIIDLGKIIAQGSPKELLQKNPDCNRLEDLFLKLTGKKLRD